MNDDLISRKELRKAFKKSQFFTEVNLYYARQLIDNAPTVLHDNYAMGYQDGVKKVLSERPQGEWVYDNILNNWKCSECGETPKTIGYVGTMLFMEQHFKFCNHCGADMRKEVENE